MRKTNIFYLIIIFLGYLNNLNAQSGAVSPYTYFGIGATENFTSSRFSSMGQTGIALPSNYILNSRNPASLSTIPRSALLYDLGIQGSINVSKSPSDKQSRTDGGISNLGIGYRINSNFSMMLGLEPVSQSKYSINVNIPIEGTATNYPVTLEGEGGMSRIFSSVAFRLNDNLSLGGTVNYFFGTVDQSQTINVNSETVTQFLISKDHQYSGIGFGLGMQYRHKFNDKNSITFGGILNFKSKIAQTTETIASTIYSETTTEESVDEIRDNVYLPLETGAGIALDFGRNLTLTADYSSKKWDKLDYTATNETYRNENIFGLGAEFRPKSLSYSEFYKKLAYRFGLNYSTGNFKVNREEVDKASVSFGIGIPVSKSGMSINLNYNLTKKGWISDAYIKDTYHLFSISFSGIENWFIKPMIN